jgi:hypothetical protein
MIIAVLGILDIIAGGVMALGGIAGAAESIYLLYFTAIFFLKALYSIGTALAEGFFFDVLGWLDLMAAVSLLFLYWQISFGLFFWLGMLMIIKGVYSLVVAFIQ